MQDKIVGIFKILSIILYSSTLLFFLTTLSKVRCENPLLSLAGWIQQQMFLTFFLLFSLFICRHAESQEIYIVEFVLLSPVYAISELDSDSKKLHQAKWLQLQ